jgi:hypothetical protein
MLFERYIGIDYSGAETPESSLQGLCIYVADHSLPPTELHCSPGPRRYWTRREIAEWLTDFLSESPPALVGIDHGFSFPLRYFEKYRLAPDWSAFLEDFRRYWPTDGKCMYVDFIRDGVYGNGAARTGSPRWRRLTEERAGRTKSVFHFQAPGSVGKATYAGLPWLRYMRLRLGQRVHFWPFDGWEIPAGRSVMAEVFPALWRRGFPQEDRNPHQQDAFSIASWMRRADRDGSLSDYFHPHLNEIERSTAAIEGWILGAM